jgi:PAS domain S-box-containing protein
MIAGAYAVLGGLVAMVGWVTNVPRLTDWRNDGISMFPNTALCAIASGLALALTASAPQFRTAARLLAILAASVGGLTLLEHVTGVNLGIDTLLLDRPWGQGAAVAPMRMGPPASLSFLLMGAALVLAMAGGSARGVAAALGLTVAAVAMLSLSGHLYGAEQMYTLPRLTGIAFPTSSILFVLGIGLVASLPDREPMRVLLDTGTAGTLARRALPVAIVVPFAIGWVRITIQARGLVDTAFGTALRTVVEAGLFTACLWPAVAMIRAHERALRDSEEALRRNAAQLTTILDTAAVGLSRVDPEGVILWANDAELEMLGYSRDRYVGHHVGEFHADAEEVADVLACLRRRENLEDHQARVRTADGSVAWILIDATVVVEDDRVVHSQWFTRDITERKRDERARALLSGIIADSDDAIVSKTLEGIITSWNAGAERMFGWTAAEAIGKPIDLIIPSDRLEEEREILRQLRAGERVDHFETVRRTKDGRTFDISLTISPVKDSSGKIVGASKIARDITDRRRLETEREEATRRKDEFLAILAHELRNPLAPVRSATRYLKIKGAQNPELRRPIEMIERQVAQMSRLIDDLLDLSRISRGVLGIRRVRVPVSEIVDAAVDAMRDELHAQGHALRTNMPDEPIMLLADRDRLVQVLCNLLGNAAKYTPAGGHVEVAVAATRDLLQISVKDDGIGIPPAKLTEIFELFARVDPSLDRQGGLGIGLTLVRQLVELHGGTIEARSLGVGYGSEFVLELPVVVTATTITAARDDTTRACTPRRVLVADDNRDAAESLKLLLELSGHDVHTVFDGEAAVRCAETFVPDVALVDIAMPRANGYEVARRIREHPWGKGIYLVALTGWGQEDDKRRAREAGFDAHLVKPVPPEALDRMLTTMSDQNPIS